MTAEKEKNEIKSQFEKVWNALEPFSEVEHTWVMLHTLELITQLSELENLLKQKGIIDDICR